MLPATQSKKAPGGAGHKRSSHQQENTVIFQNLNSIDQTFGEMREHNNSKEQEKANVHVPNLHDQSSGEVTQTISAHNKTPDFSLHNLPDYNFGVAIALQPQHHQ